MKRLKKILAMAIAMAMVIAMALPAFASSYGEQNQAHTITINNSGNGTHTYAAYQIFKGNLDADEDTLTDIQWGTGVNSANLLSALKTVNTDFPAELKSGDESLFKDCTTAADVAKVLATDHFKTAANLDAFARIAAANKATAMDTQNAASGASAVLNVTGDGYYMVLDETTTLPDGDTASKIILNVVQNVTINAKATQISPDKEIVEESANVKAGTAAIGDEVQFQVVIDVPDTTNYKNKFIFQMYDKLPLGMTFKQVDSIAIYKADDIDTAANNKIKEGKTPILPLTGTNYNVTTAANGTDISDPTSATTQAAFSAYQAPADGNYVTAVGGQVIKVKFLNFKTLAETTNATTQKNYIGEKIVVTYTAVVNDDATYGATSNKNEVEFKFSNDPNHSYDGENDDFETTDPAGKTPQSETDTYVTALEIYKFDKATGTKVALQGATFKLTGTNVLNYTLNTGEAYIKKTDYDAAETKPTRADTSDYYELKDGSYTTTVAGSEVGGRTVNDTQYVDKNVVWYKITVNDVVTAKQADYTTTATSNTSGLIEFKGLNAGTYTIEETVAPEGYNKIDGTASLVIAWMNPADIPDTGRTADQETAAANGGFYITGADKAKFSFATSSDGDSISTIHYEVENNKGQVLPSTGGIGTTIFYVVGAILVIGAGVVLITKRRMDA